jgi:plasmid stabilization system protein ParE
VKPIVFHPEALAKLQEQAVFYEERSAGLGTRFLTQVEAAVRLAASMPGIGSRSANRPATEY